MHWNYNSGDSIIVKVYTNQPEVELFLNQKFLGIRTLKEEKDHIFKWLVPYAGGELKAMSVNSKASQSIVSAGLPHAIDLRIDGSSLKANSYDVAHVTVQLMDENNIPVLHMDKQIKFLVEGPAKLLGVDNGSPSSVQDYQSNKIHTSSGKALLLIQSMNEIGKVTITATVESEKMREGIVSIQIQ